MTTFHIEIDNKFKNAISKMKKDNFKMSDLTELKSFINDTYKNENSIIDKNIKRAYNKIDYKF